jgi:CRP-like cAMP-binding protein
MPKRPPPAAAPRNRFLARLPAAVYRRLLPLLQPVTLADKQILFQPRGPIDYAYFPSNGVLSALTIMRDGNAIEVATIGNEGLVGPYGFNGRTSPHRVIVQVGDGGHRLAARALQEEAARDGPLKELLSGDHVAFMFQVSQSVACNGLHRLEQRCCRWLLMTRDRVGSDELRLTHEYLAIMLGARRASVTEALRPLQEAGLVKSYRGRITILDGAGLEAGSCECYFVVREEYDRLLGDAT